jgi:hypothetical protein
MPAASASRAKGSTGLARAKPAIAASARAISRADTAASANPSIPRSRCSVTASPIAPNPPTATRNAIYFKFQKAQWIA